MDTNLKRSKKIRAFIYRVIAVSALFTMLATAILGREAFVNLYKEGQGTLTGDIYYLTEFREYIGKLYTQAMIGIAGPGDENGYPLNGSGTGKIAANSLDAFYANAALADKDLVYYAGWNDFPKLEESVTFPLFSEYDNHLLLSDDLALCCYWNGFENRLEFFSQTASDAVRLPRMYYKEQYSPSNREVSFIRLVIAVKDTGYYVSDYLQELDEQAKGYRNILLTFFISGTVFVLSAFLCLCSIRTKKAGKEAFASRFAKIQLEYKLLPIIVLLYLCYDLHLWHFDGRLQYRIIASNYLFLYVPTFILLYLLSVDFRHNKSQVLYCSFAYSIFCYIQEFWESQTWKRKALVIHLAITISAFLLIISGGVLVLLFLYGMYLGDSCLYLGLLLVLIGIVIFALSCRLKAFIKDTASIADKLSDIQIGHCNTPLVLKGTSLLKQAAEDLNRVEEGIEAAVEESNRAGRMRVELITNVSHDLKTPLTSIINYADLLCEENLPAPAGEYASSLRSKAYRLKGMVQDVFELSKATSGNLSIEAVRLDLAKLVRQTLADMDERIQESSLTFKLNISDEPIFIEADGEKLYRVFQNLFVNALQYSLENSRVHIQLTMEDGYAHARVKNTSKQELDFDPKEIVERFVRADASRTSEGSGLGLSIVQSFTEACGGSFSVELNADLFTAHVSFPLSTLPVENSDEESLS